MDHTLLQKYRIYYSKKLLPVVDFGRSLGELGELLGLGEVVRVTGCFSSLTIGHSAVYEDAQYLIHLIALLEWRVHGVP